MRDRLPARCGARTQDRDAPLAEASRRALLQRASDDGLRIYAVHFPFPGLGRVEAQGDRFVAVPER